jgi:3-hydroxybutyryl-CoA dehydrogenase
MMDAAPRRAGVLGGGRMGAGIAHAFLLAGSTVVVVERDEASAAQALDRVTRAIRSSVDRATTTETEAALIERLETGTDIDAFADCDLVIEAVPEDRELKAASLARIEAAVSTAAAIATNTSSISVDSLADSLAHPGRLLGMHFFNPVPASALVEVVVGSRTDPGLVDRALSWVRALGKTPVTVNDAPGFASSRLGVVIALEAIRMVEQGVASPADIDAAMVLGYRHPVGPLRTTDLVGLDVRLGIAEYLHPLLGEAFRPPELLRELVAAGKLGRKSGEGFFVWRTDD